MPFHALEAHTLQLPEVAVIAVTMMHTIKQTLCEMNAYYSSLSVDFWILFLRCADRIHDYWGGNCKSAIFALRFESVLCHRCEHRSASDIVCPGENGYVKPARTGERDD